MNIALWGDELPAWVTAAALAHAGNQVFLVREQMAQTPAQLMSNNTKKEPGLHALVEAEHQAKRLQLCSPEKALALDIHIFSMNPGAQQEAEQHIAAIARQHPNTPLLIINQSHFGVGCTEQLQAHLNLHDNQCVVYLAENLSEGAALEHIRHQKSVTLGCNNDWALMKTKALLRPFTQHIEQLLVMTPTEAELAKLAATGMLALRIGYINELANLAEQLNVDIDLVRQSMMSDPRIGHHFLSPGCGFGGNIFSQTIQGLSDLLAEKRQSTLMRTILQENEKQKELPFRKLWRHYDCDIHGLTVAIWGVSFKPGSSALDSAPSLKTIEALLAQDAKLQIHDPEALDNIQRHFGEHPLITLCQDKYAATQQADALLLLTEWPEYWSPDYEQLLAQMNAPLIIDGRNIYDRELLTSLGFTYYGVGR